MDGWTPQPGPSDAGSVKDPPRIEGFSVTSPLGAGGFAEVWAATRAGSGDPVAIKVGVADGAVLRERFAREVSALQRLGPPHTPAVYGQGQLADGRPYVIMERLVGETLADHLGALPEPPDLGRIQRIARALLAALAAAHARGILHRDLKPENVFLAGERVALLDFGLTRGVAEDSDLTRAGVAVGTPEYMAPEQIRGDPRIDARADVYAFGVLFYELFTLRTPFVGVAGSIEHGHQVLRPPRPSEIAPVPQAIEDLMLRCLAKDRDRRPADAAALLAAFEEACAEVSVDAPTQREPSSAGGPRRAIPKLIAEGQQFVVVLVTDSTGLGSKVIASITGRGGLVARQRGRRYVAVFPAEYADNPLGAALTAARELEERDRARAAVHIAAVTIRRKDRGAPTVYGAAVDRPETWLPPDPWSGVQRSAEVDRILAEGAADGATPPLPSGDSSGSIASLVEAPILGRDDAIGAMQSSAAGAFERGAPALFTLLGDAGLGKSLLAREAVAIVRGLCPEALVISIRAAQPDRGERFPLAEELVGRLSDAPADPPADHRARVEAVAAAIRRRARAGPIAVVIDDAHRADDAVLDALEVATFEDQGCPLWVLVAAHPRLAEVRRSFGERTRHRARLVLAPLDKAATRQLAAELLRPAEYPPEAVLERLAGWSGGNPGSMTEVVRALKRAGIVKRRGKTRSYYVATAVLDSLPPSPAWQWLATRQLGALPPEIAASLRLCSVLGITFSEAELEGVQDVLERARSAGTSADAGVALRALGEGGLIQPSAGDRWQFQHALFQDAVYEMLDPLQRTEVHRAALSHWRARADREGATAEILGPIARHAAAAGDREAAADAWMKLGEIVLGEHRHADADHHFTAALELLGEGDAGRRARALVGRGRCRYRIGRARDACEDLVAGRVLAVALGDRALEAIFLLEEATALDWLREFERAAEPLAEARAIIAALGDPALGARLLVAEGRACVRRERVAESIALLERGRAAAVAHGDYETQVIALMFLSFQLGSSGRLDEAEELFEELIAVTTEAKDWAHLCTAYNNRPMIWHARGELPLVLADLRRAVDLARASGDPLAERLAAVCGAQILHMSGASEKALELARRACTLEERFSEEPTAMGPLLLARILLSQGQLEEVPPIVRALRRASPPELTEPSEMGLFLKSFSRMLTLVAEEIAPDPEGQPETGGGWDELVATGEGGLRTGVMSPDDLLEIAYWRAFMALRAGRAREAERALRWSVAWRENNPAWRSRLEDLDRRLAGEGTGEGSGKEGTGEG